MYLILRRDIFIKCVHLLASIYVTFWYFPSLFLSSSFIFLKILTLWIDNRVQSCMNHFLSPIIAYVRQRREETSTMWMIMTKGMFCIWILHAWKQCSGLVAKSINWQDVLLQAQLLATKCKISCSSNWIWGGDDIAICNWLENPTWN